jgi:hypothetical protein
VFGEGYFLAFACAGSVARSLCGCAAGATRAALTQHFARRANAADIAAKEGSQETAVTLAGMALGVVVTRLTADSVAGRGLHSSTSYASTKLFLIYLSLSLKHRVNASIEPQVKQ